MKGTDWNIMSEKRNIKSSVSVAVPYIQRADGFSMKLIGGGREFEIFQGDGKFGRLAFYASRRDEFEVRDEYIVQTRMTPNRKELHLNRDVNEALIQAHAKDIESALLHFSAGRQFNYKPVSKVLFQLEEPLINGHPNKVSKLVRADEV